MVEAPDRDQRPEGAETGAETGAPGQNGARDPLGGSAYEQIRDAIRNGRLKPGDRVTESEIANWLKMSRTPVREAVFRLETEGLLTRQSRQGLTVAKLDYQAVIELYAMREVLEGTAAHSAALHASQPEVEALREMLEIERSIGEDDPTKAADANRRFHQIIYHAAHNRYLLKSLNALSNAMILLGHTTLAMPGRHATALEEHEALVEAIAARDAEAAQAAARNHIRAAQRHRVLMILSGEGMLGEPEPG